MALNAKKPRLRYTVLKNLTQSFNEIFEFLLMLHKSGILYKNIKLINIRLGYTSTLNFLLVYIKNVNSI